MEEDSSDPTPEAWKGLLVGEPSAAQAVLARALARIEFQGAALQWLQAGSARAALELLPEHPDVALMVLLTDLGNAPAMLELAQAVRGGGGNRSLQMVVVTDRITLEAQPQIAMRSEIHGCCLETELDTHQLPVVIHSALNHGLALRELDLAQKLLLGELTLRAAIVESSDDAIIGKTLDGIITSWNRGAERMFGYEAREMLGTAVMRIIPADRATEEATVLASIRSGRPIQHYETERLHRDGRLIPISLTVSPIRDLHGNIIGASKIAREISERKRAEKERLQFQESVNQLQKMEALGTLVSGVAHTINNILAVAMGAASLREGVVADLADQEAYRSIAKVCRRGREVVKALIHFSRPTPVIQTPLDLNALIQEVCALLENTTRSQIRITASLTPEPAWINGNPGDLNLVLVNLGINALEAMPGGGTLLFRTTALPGNRVEVWVEDHGIGMTPETLARVMEPFYTTKGAGQATGLGLSMAYGVVKAHQGTLEITSQPGKGTGVRLRFPGIPAPLERQTARAPIPAPGPALESWKVYLVDDDDDVRFLMTRMLKRAGVGHVKAFASGAAALTDLGGEALPDLIVLDQNMPGLNGVQTMGLIREQHPDLPILISSGQPDIDSWECLRQRRVAVISKPFTLEEIQAKLGRFAAETNLGR